MPIPPPIGNLRRALVWMGRLLLGLYFAIGLTILAGRHFLMPELAGQKSLVEERLAAAIGLPVQIGALGAEWPGLYPQLHIEGLQIHDAAGRPALAFDRVEAEIGWSSLLHFELRLHRLEVFAPQLDLRRDAAGTLFVAGLAMQGESDGGFARWLLAQSRIVVRDARLSWHDELRGAPPLELHAVNFQLRNFGWHHSFGLSAEPPADVATRLDLRGKLVGSDPADPADWRGELYADVEQADLSALRPWLDLPLEWRRGKGGVRLWVDFADRMPTGFTADLRLADVEMRLRPGLAPLVLEQLDGRLRGRRDGDGYAGEARRLTLATADGIRLPPTDAQFELTLAGRRAGGRFSANVIDIGALAALAGHLPLPEQLHRRLGEFAPRGRLAELEVGWEGVPDAPTHWRAKGSFAGLALAAHKELPGFAGLSGRFAGDAKQGEVKLDSRQLSIALPAVFPEPVLALDALQADAGWHARAGGIEFTLARAAFHNADASGDAAGSYRYTGSGLGEIDLSAKLTRADGSAVWRYMPLVVNKDARDWLQRSIVGGRSDNATLRLKGPLAEFPFRDGKGGIFQVKGTIRGATLDYAPGWPRITGIDGELLFEGVRMLIRAQRGDIMGVALADVRAEIAELDAYEELLTVSGKARGETQRFLDFIEASPVGTRIDHFTEAMRATGRGELDLRLDLPLRRIDTTRVKGAYKFADNVLQVLPVLPPLTAAQGEFGFTGDRLLAKNLRARLLGAPVGADVTTVAGGAVRIDAKGSLTAQGLRQEYAHSAFEHLSGETSWRAAITVKKPAAEVRIESSLEGLASSLPEPFNKSARTPLPLRLDARIDPQRDEWTGTLGSVAALRLLQAGSGNEAWRGRIAVGTPPQRPAALPERGIALAVVQPQFDLDAWRALATPANGSGGLALAALELRSPALRLLQRDFHDVRVDGTQSGGRWRFQVDSREVKGQANWEGAGAGRFTGRFAQLHLPASVVTDDGRADETQELPAIDLAADNFRLRDMALGELRLNAENRDGAWQAKLDLKNEDARLAGEGRWRPSRSAPESALKFRLDVEDGEKLLARLGMPDAVRRGDGLVEGDLRWAGTPFRFDLPSMTGRLRADLGKGQFKKLEPGVGRLLGVLSLQSLPRRITLDFRDIFSEGFAFDSIVGEAAVGGGMLRTEELKIRGPAAKILLSGQASLVAETQDLKVRVQPAIGETVAVGAMIANPVAGAVAWAAQKLLNDPLDQVFAYEYAVTGPWSDPQVEKINRNVEAKATP